MSYTRNQIRYNRKTVEIKTQPATLLISVADMKLYLRVDGSDDDAIIEDFIIAATRSVRNYLRRSLITETLILRADGFGPRESVLDQRLDRLGAGVHTVSYNYVQGYSNEINLQFLPIQSVTSITTYNRDNTSALYDSSNYQLDEQGGRIYLNEGSTWPDNLRDRESVEIEYVSGYGDTPDDVPADIVQAVKMLVAKYYDCREMCAMPPACKEVLSNYRILDELAS